jgi:redox-sensitive bicupin YhaK (pirin superfamily)
MRAASDAAETLAFGEREIALYVVDGDVTVDEQVIPKLGMVFVKDPSRVHVRAAKAARVVAIGGAPFPEPRHMWWNFVSSRKERIRQAADDWQHQRMGQVVDETEFIPLPNDPLPK